MQDVSFCPCAALYERVAGLAFRNLHRKEASPLPAIPLTPSGLHSHLGRGDNFPSELVVTSALTHILGLTRRRVVEISIQLYGGMR